MDEVANHLILSGNGQVALSTHFVDGLLYEDVYEELLEARANRYDTIGGAPLHTVDYFDYKKSLKQPKSAPYKVAVVYANGNIVEDKGSSDEIGENLVDCLHRLRENKSVKAVVLRINSGGGSALMSDRIWRETVLLKEVKPVVVSMGDMAASGGYYIACAADFIVAEPTTITGSIGVFGIQPNVGRTLSDKLGLHVETVKTNPYADMGSMVRPMSVYERNVMQQSVDRVYDTFVKRVADGRHIGWKYVANIAQGRVWSGKEALGIGLVDTLGGMETAVAYAVKKAELANYSIIERPLVDSFFSSLSASFAQTRQERLLRSAKGSLFHPYFKLAKMLERMQGVQAMLPFQLEME